MKLFISESSPLIDVPSSSEEAQFQLLSKKKNLDFAQQHAVGSHLVALGIEMRQLTTRDGFSLVWIDSGRVVYWTYYTLLPMEWGKTFVQKSVWTSSDEKYRGFARKMLIQYFLPKYKFILSSDTQRELGIRMWYSLLKESFALGLYVYLLAGDGSVSSVDSFDFIDDHYDDIWGHSPVHKDTRVMISNTKI